MSPRMFSGFDASAFHPAFSSPLNSSSPIRASSESPPSHALSERDPNILPRFREIQSSPITAKQQKFKYATRNARPNPVVKRREDAQECRRKLFLQNVQQRRETQRWENRGGETELLRLEWARLKRELREAQESDASAFMREEELEDEPLLDMIDEDSMMLDDIEREEQAQLDALLESMPETHMTEKGKQDIAQFSDEADYDAIFEELLASEDVGITAAPSQDVEMA
ncbi:hypothetical protein OQA88_6444 [Cercophora sp. LCS_1]